MRLAETEHNEREFWNSRAQTLMENITYYGDLVNTRDNKLLSLHQHAIARLGDVKGKRILDCGCGYGAISCYLAKQGAKVTAMDISDESIAISRAWFEKNGVADLIETRTASAHELPFEDGTFDCVVGSCILHHLDLSKALPEIQRVLKHGGKAVFVENNGTNPVLMFFRNQVLAPLKMRRGSPDESPIDAAKLAEMDRMFPGVKSHYPEMIFTRFVSSFFFKDLHYIRLVFERFDTFLAWLFPSTRRWSYFNVLEFDRSKEK